MRAIVGVLPRQPRVTSCVLYFEKAAWLALTSVLPTVTVRGCNFHWAQAVWRKVQEHGLQVTVKRLLLKFILERFLYSILIFRKVVTFIIIFFLHFAAVLLLINVFISHAVML